MILDMKKLLLLLFLSLGFTSSTNAATAILICDAKSVEITEWGARTTFPSSTKTFTMIVEINKKEITNIKIKEKLYSGDTHLTKYKILKQDKRALTAIDNSISSHGAEILFLNKENGRFSIANLTMSAALGTTGRCYE